MFILRPGQKLRLEDTVQGGDRKNIHTAAPPAVLVSVWIQKIPVKGEPQKFIVKSQGIVSKTDRTRGIHLFMDSTCGFVFTNTFVQFINRQTVYKQCSRRRNDIRTQLHLYFAPVNLAERIVGSDTGECQNLVENGVQPACFQIVKQIGSVHGYKKFETGDKQLDKAGQKAWFKLLVSVVMLCII